MSDELDHKASQLARMLTRLQITANAGQPLLVLRFNVKNIRRMCDELLELSEGAEPTTTVRMDPTLGDATADLLREYIDGALILPDHVPDDWKE